MSRPLDPVSLKHFVAVCEEGNIARAAARESLVASALSKRVSALEAEVGVPLLTRRRRGVEPTAAGQALLVRAREVLAGLDQMRVELSAYGQGVQGSVRVLPPVGERLPDDGSWELTGSDMGAMRGVVAGGGAGRPSLRFVDTLDQPSINVSPGGQMDQLLLRQAALAGRLPAYRMQVSLAQRMAGHLVAAAAGTPAPGAEPA